MYYYGFKLMGAVREAVARLAGEFTYEEVCRLVKEEHPEFDAGDNHAVSECLNLLARQGRLVRVKAADRRARTPGVYRKPGGMD